MKLAVNYSHQAAELWRAGTIQVDLFKCPAWPDLIAEAQSVGPVYVHFPLRVGPGHGDAINPEPQGPPDWQVFEALMEQTHTPEVNLHLSPTGDDYAPWPVNTTNPEHIERVTGNLIRDVGSVVARFGGERVIIENIFEFGGQHMWAALLPSVIQRVIEETGCGFLLDLSHATIAARCLGMDAYEYVRQLPTDYIHEVHISGTQYFQGPWVAKLQRAGIDPARIAWLKGQFIDHLPMTDANWALSEWALQKMHAHAWGQPWVVTLEYGGVGPFFQALTDTNVLTRQVPRLYDLVVSTQAIPAPEYG